MYTCKYLYNAYIDLSGNVNTMNLQIFAFSFKRKVVLYLQVYTRIHLLIPPMRKTSVAMDI